MAAVFSQDSPINEIFVDAKSKVIDSFSRIFLNKDDRYLWWKAFYDTQAVIAGGYIVNIIQQIVNPEVASLWKSNDIDIWVESHRSMTYFTLLLRDLNYYYKITNIKASCKGNDTYSRLKSYVEAIYTFYHITPGQPQFQFIVVCKGKSINDLIKSFDIIATQFLFKVIDVIEKPGFKYEIVDINSNSLNDIKNKQINISDEAIKIQSFGEWYRTLERMLKYNKRGLRVNDTQLPLLVEAVNIQYKNRNNNILYSSVKKEQWYSDCLEVICDYFEKLYLTHCFTTSKDGIQYTISCEKQLVSTECLNLISLEQIPIEKVNYKNNVVFVTIDDKGRYGTIIPRSNVLVKSLFSRVFSLRLIENENIYYECERRLATKILVIKSKNPFVKISLCNGEYYVSVENLEDINKILKEKQITQPVFIIDTRRNGTTISLSTSKASREAWQGNGIITGRHHCKEGTDKIIQSMTVQDFTRKE